MNIFNIFFNNLPWEYRKLCLKGIWIEKNMASTKGNVITSENKRFLRRDATSILTLSVCIHVSLFLVEKSHILLCLSFRQI